MKLFLTLLCISLFLVKSNHFGKDKLGLSSNKGESELAVSYSIAGTKVDSYYAQNAKNFRTPQIVNRLPDRINLNTGERFTPDVLEKQGNSDYYDGTRKLGLRSN